MRYDYERKLYLDFDGLWSNDSDDLCLLLILSPRDISILLNAIRYASFGSRWLDSNGRLLRDTGRDADLAIALDYIEQLERRILGVACLEDLTNAIIAQGEAIKAGLIAIAQKPCCPSEVNLQIVQGATGLGDTLYGTQPGSVLGDPETDPPPEGFETWEAYRTYKCQLANWITDSLIDTYRNLGVMQLSALFVGSVAVGAALGGMVTFIPPAAVVLLIAGLVGLGISLSVVNAIGGWLSDNRSDVVCMFYNADSTAIAADGFWSLVQEAMEELTIASSLAGWLKQITFALLTTDFLNNLFNDSLQVNYPNADCGGCEDISCDGIVPYVTEGNPGQILSTGDDEIGCYLIAGATEYLGAYAVYLNFEVAEGNDEAYVRLDSVTSGGLSGGWRRIWYDASSNPDPLGQPTLPHPSNYAVTVAAVDFSDTPFTIKIYYGPTTFV